MGKYIFAVVTALAMPPVILAGVEFANDEYARLHTVTAMHLAADPENHFDFHHGPEGEATFQWGWWNDGYSVTCKGGSVAATNLPKGVSIEESHADHLCASIS